ncbi:MAG TPA: hypothetical protein VFF06_18175 [Polyangia bacterium]|nr:hypothetical protein [Polyangia bacterium]
MASARLGAVALTALIGCARAPSVARPETGLAAYRRALERDDARAAYALLAADVRQRVTEAEFAARWRATVEERKNQSAQLQVAVTERQVTEHARVVRADGRSSFAVLEQAGWRVTAPRSSEPGPQTPEEALRRFARALEQHSLESLLALLSDPLRGLVEHEIEERLGRLKKALGQPVTVDGDHARVLYDPRFHVDLKRENGTWRVADFN